MEKPSGLIPIDGRTSYRYVGGGVIWESGGKTVIRLSKDKDDRNLALHIDESFLPNIRQFMEENNKAGLPKSTLEEKPAENTGFLTFYIEPNNNPSLQWRDWLTQINHLIKSKGV